MFQHKCINYSNVQVWSLCSSRMVKALMGSLSTE